MKIPLERIDSSSFLFRYGLKAVILSLKWFRAFLYVVKVINDSRVLSWSSRTECKEHTGRNALEALLTSGMLFSFGDIVGVEFKCQWGI